MQLKELITADMIAIYPSARDWEDAVRKACQPLVASDAVESRYVEAVCQVHNEFGPYYVLAPGVAMPHASPDDGVNRLALSLIVVQDGVYFGSESNDPVKLLVALAAPDADAHVALIAQLMDLFLNENDLQRLFESSSVADVLAVLAQY